MAMTVDVVASPDNENEMEEFRFVLRDVLTLEIVRFRQYRREDAAAPWHVAGEWLYPDVFHTSTLPQPEVPAWAMLDAKTFLSQKIQFR
jgi:hypothetical protein